GWGPGIVATILSSIGAVFFVMPPRLSFAMHDPGGAFSLAVYVVEGVVVSLLCEELHRARRRAEQTEKIQGWLAAIVRSSNDAIVGKTLDGIITTWNAGAERMYGYPAREAIGRHVSMLAPPDHVDEIMQNMRRLRAGEYVDDLETVRRAKDGRTLNVLL